MSRTRDRDTRYFVEIDRKTLRLVRCGYDDKRNLDKGRQTDPSVHRLFLTAGQYNKFVERCADDLGPVLDGSGGRP